MKARFAFLAAIAVCAACVVRADYLVQDEGTWPESWPDELDAFRSRSRSFEGPLRPLLHYAIPFSDRAEFEAAWPHLLKLKTPGSSIVLRRGPSFWLDDKQLAGVCVHCPPAGTVPEDAGATATGNTQRTTTYIELIVDGDIVDLNRIPLPPDTAIVDERFPARDAN